VRTESPVTKFSALRRSLGTPLSVQFSCSLVPHPELSEGSVPFQCPPPLRPSASPPCETVPPSPRYRPPQGFGHALAWATPLPGPQPQRGELPQAHGNALGNAHHQKQALSGRTKTPPTDPNWQMTNTATLRQKRQHTAVLNSNSVSPSLIACPSPYSPDLSFLT